MFHISGFMMIKAIVLWPQWLKLFVLVSIVLGQTASQKNVIVSEGNGLVLECKSGEMHKRFTWEFIDLSNGKHVIYTSSEEPQEGYSFNCSIERQQCPLEIRSVSQNHAGSYTCKASEEGKQLVPLEHYNLNVGKLECSSNIPPGNVAVAESDCDNVETTNLALTCNLVYRGSWTDVPVGWKKKWQNGTAAGQMDGKPQRISTGTEDKSIALKAQEKVKVDMKEQIFECSVQDATSRHNIMPCNVHLGAISYVRNRRQKSPSMSTGDRKAVKCEADTSASIPCNYEWIVPNSEARIEGSLLEPKDMKDPGTYRCLATCSLANRNECTVTAAEFELTGSATASLGTIVIAVVVAVVVIVALVFLVFFIWRRSRREPKKKDEEAPKDVPLLPRPPADTPIPVAGQPPPHLSDQPSNGMGSGSQQQQQQPSSSSGKRKISFRRGTSGKGSQDFNVIAEEGDRNQVNQVGQKILLNDARGPAMGIGHLNGKIYCVAKNSNRLFIFMDCPPYNRMIPEEMTVSDLENPQAMAVCRSSNSIYVSEYSDKNSVYRIFPTEKEGNRVSKGRLDGSPGSLAVVSSKPNTVVAVLKRDRKMHVEIYDSSICRRGGSVSDVETWEKKYVISPAALKEMKLPLFVCTSVSEDLSPGSERLCLLYGSGAYSKTGEFEAYKVARINLETSLVYATYDFKDVNSGGGDAAPGEKFVPVAMESDGSRGGLLVLEKRGQLVHLNPDLTQFHEEAKLGSSLSRLCFRPEERLVVLGSSNKPHLTCFKLKDAPVGC